ncbi:MAG: o-succinylbenzoate synthase [Thermomicrobiales bacterium]
MRITRVDLLHVRMELVRGFETSSHRKNDLNHILVRVHDDAGHVGWGECAVPTDPYYCPETTETAWSILRDFMASTVIGQEIGSPEELLARYAKVRGNNFARSGLEMAYWALLATVEDQPLARMLGATRPAIVSGVSLGIERDVARLLDVVGEFVAQGYPRVKLKIAPGWDLIPVAAVRERWPDLPVQVDANSAYTLDQISQIKELDRFGLLMIEQPLGHDDIVDHARIQAALDTPICLDESIHTAEDARKALDLNAGRIINIKTSRLGGLLEAKKTHDLCYARGIPVWCGGMHEYGVGRAANVAIAALPGFTLPGDVSGSDKYYARDITTVPILATDGAIPVPTTPGLGYDVDEEYVRAQTICALSRSAGADIWQNGNAAWAG